MKQLIYFKKEYKKKENRCLFGELGSPCPCTSFFVKSTHWIHSGMMEQDKFILMYHPLYIILLVVW